MSSPNKRLDGHAPRRCRHGQYSAKENKIRKSVERPFSPTSISRLPDAFKKPDAIAAELKTMALRSAAVDHRVFLGLIDLGLIPGPPANSPVRFQVSRLLRYRART